MTARLKDLYKNKIQAEIKEELKLSSVMDVPRLSKIVINSGVGEAITNSNAINEVVEVITLIAGQKPIVTKSKKAVSGFKLRENMEIGVSVTLRGEKMWHFFDKIINIVFPRTKDFRGMSLDSFDGNGNYSFGVKEHVAFPEIDPNKVQKIRGLQITFVFKSKSDEDTKVFLDKFGFPFVKDVNKS